MDSGSLLPSCAPGEPVFTQLPIALADFRGLAPLGHLAPPPHTFPTDHMYFILRAGTQVSLVSPGDLTVVRIVSTEYSTSPPFTDYAIYMRPCRDVEIYFAHLKTLAPSFQAKLGTLDPAFCQMYVSGGMPVRQCDAPTAFGVAAGEALGVAGGDFGAKDARVAALDYADPANNPANADGVDSLHIVCPADYFRDDLRTALRERISDTIGVSTVPPDPWCGAVMQDVRGTGQGRWFPVGARLPGQDDPNLALVRDYDWNTARQAFSVGTSAGASGLTYGVYFFHPAAEGNINSDFQSVTADGSMHCYQELSGVVTNGVEEALSPPMTILLQLTSPTTLRIERRMEATCAAISPWAFDDRATDFQR
jgi:hypothetical protein